MTFYYAGIGSRSTPPDVLMFMEQTGMSLALKGWKLRSGNAPGADQAFASGHNQVDPSSVELYLPWRGFEGYTIVPGNIVKTSPEFWAYTLGEFHHPAWHRLSDGGKKLMARNSHQIIGLTENDLMSAIVICWTPGGYGGDGTGQAIRIATARGIPVFDLGNERGHERVMFFVEGA